MQRGVLREVVVDVFAIVVELPHLHGERVLLGLILVFIGLRISRAANKASQQADSQIFNYFCHYYSFVAPMQVKFAAKIIETRQIVKFNFKYCIINVQNVVVLLCASIN